jgi:glycosyltransferase involved in cell wall biosynthesis
MINVLGLCSYPIESAATRYRLMQFVEPLRKKGINLEISSFLDSEDFGSFYNKDENVLKKLTKIGQPLLRRTFEITKVKNFDLLFVQREAMMFGPAFFEWVFQKIGNIPMILDLDDATYVRYVSPTYGRTGSFFKFFGKTDKLIKRARTVTCGNRYIAEYIEKNGRKAVVVPTVADTEIFCPAEKKNKIPIIGWIGTHSTLPFVESIFPILQKLAGKHEFVLKIVGAGRDKIQIEGVKIENSKWSLKHEVADFQSLDIGLYPMRVEKSAPEEWIMGKSGFKAIQYLAVGAPFVMSPFGICAEIGQPDLTHFNADENQEWYNSLDKLLANRNLRRRMGENGRRHSLAHYTVSKQADILAEVFRGIK